MPRWAWIAHILTLAIGGIYVLRIDHRMWFWFDDWDFVDDRGLVHSNLGLWAPHNDHWSTLPILAYRALLTMFGMRSYLPFLLLLVALHMMLAHVLWRLGLRMGASPLVTTMLVAIFGVLGSGYQNIGWAFQIGFLGSLLFGWLWLWVTDHDEGFGRRDIVGWAAGLASLMCSGIGIPMLMATAIAVSVRRSLRDAVVAVSVPGATFLIWYAVYGKHARRSTRITSDTILQTGAYAWKGIENAFSSALGFPGVGAVIAVSFAFCLLRRPLAVRPSDAAGRAGAITVVLALLFIAIGRSGLGIDQADESRYVYIVVALVLPVAAVLLSEMFPPRVGPTLVFALLCGVVCIINVNDLRVQEVTLADRVTTAEQEILGSYDLANGGGYVLAGARTVNYVGPQPSIADLRRIRRSGWLNASYKVSPSVLLGDEARMQVGLLSPGVPAPPTVAGQLAAAAHLALSANLPGCVTAEPNGNGPTISLAPASAPVLLTFTRDTPGTLTGTLRTAGAMAGIKPVHLTGDSRVILAATGVAAVLGLPSAGATTICGLGASGFDQRTSFSP